MQLTGQVTKQPVDNGDGLVLHRETRRGDVVISPSKAASKLERDHKAQALMPVSDHELGAYESQFALVAQHANGVAAKVTGRLHKLGEDKFSLDVKEFDVVDHAA